MYQAKHFEECMALPADVDAETKDRFGRSVIRRGYATILWIQCVRVRVMKSCLLLPGSGKCEALFAQLNSGMVTSCVRALVCCVLCVCCVCVCVLGEGEGVVACAL